MGQCVMSCLSGCGEPKATLVEPCVSSEDEIVKSITGEGKEDEDLEGSDEKLDKEKDTDEREEVPEVVVDGTGEKKEANGELDKSDCNGQNKTDKTVELGAKKASGGSRSRPFFGKMFKPRSDVVADKSTTEDQTVVKIVDEGLEQTVVEETTPLVKEAELEDRYIILDKPEPVEEDDNKKEPTPNTSF